MHVTYLKFGEINTLTEKFDADVLVRAKWREPDLDDDGAYDVSRNFYAKAIIYESRLNRLDFYNLSRFICTFLLYNS